MARPRKAPASAGTTSEAKKAPVAKAKAESQKSSKRKARVVFDFAGYRNDLAERPEYGEKGQIIELIPSEYDRLKALGAIEAP